MPTSHPSVSLLALSEAAFLFPGQPDPAHGSSSFWISRQTIPSNPGNCHSLPPIPPAPHLLPVPAVMEKGCHCPQVPPGWRVALPWPGALGVSEGGAGRAQVRTGTRRVCGSSPREEKREGDEGLILAQTRHPHPKPAWQSRAEGQDWGIAFAAPST